MLAPTYVIKICGATNELSFVQDSLLILQIYLPDNSLAYQSNNLKEGYGFRTWPLCIQMRQTHYRSSYYIYAFLPSLMATRVTHATGIGKKSRWSLFLLHPLFLILIVSRFQYCRTIISENYFTIFLALVSQSQVSILLIYVALHCRCRSCRRWQPEIFFSLFQYSRIDPRYRTPRFCGQEYFKIWFQLLSGQCAGIWDRAMRE